MSMEKLLTEYNNITVRECSWMPKGLTGLYLDDLILLDKRKDLYEKHGILAEEIGHRETTHGDITNMDSIKNRKLEALARRWGYRKILSFDRMIECYEAKHLTVEEVCQDLEITPEYLNKILSYYKERYGLSVEHNGFIIRFEPFSIKKKE